MSQVTRTRRPAAVERCVLLVIITAAFVAGSTSPASAHTRTAETTNVASRVVADPTPQGVEVTVYTGGLLIGVTNELDATLVVEGYDGEPYVRIGPDGVHENARSPAAWLNRARYGDVAIPPDVDASAPPLWRHVSSNPEWIWHDHRTHWMSPQPPAFVEASPVALAAMRAELVGPIGHADDAAGSFAAWELPLTLDGQRLDVRGELVWVDPPSPWPWIVAATVVLALAFLGAHRDPERLRRRTALVIAAVAGANLIHLVDDLVAFPSDPLDELFGILHTSLFLAIGLGGAAWARWGRDGRVLALAIASGGVLYHQGLVHLPMLAASQFPTLWPDGLVRATIALGLMQSVAVALVVVSERRRAASTATPHDDPGVTIRQPA